MVLLTINMKSQSIIPVLLSVNENDTTINPIYDSGIIIFNKDIVTFKWYMGGEFWYTVDFVKDTVLNDFESKIHFSNLTVDDSVSFKSDLIVMYNPDYGYVVLEVIHKKYKKKLDGLSFIFNMNKEDDEPVFNKTLFYVTPYKKITFRRSKPNKKYLKNE